MIDLVIRGDRACDPASNYFGPAILGIENGQIVPFLGGFDAEILGKEIPKALVPSFYMEMEEI